MSALLLMLALASGPKVDSTRSLVLTYGGMALADMGGTEWVEATDGREINPFLQDRGVRLAVNAAVVFATVKGTQKLQRDGHPRAARLVKWAFIGARVIAVGIHVREATR